MPSSGGYVVRPAFLTRQRRAHLNMPQAASSLPLSAVRRGIRHVMPQLQMMLRRTRTSMALVEAMSAMTLEAGEVWEARRQLKVTAAAEGQRQRGGDGRSASAIHPSSTASSHQGAAVQKQRDEAAARSASLLQHVASLRELFRTAPKGEPKVEAVMALLSDVKAARIRRAGSGKKGSLITAAPSSSAAASITAIPRPLAPWAALKPHSHGSEFSSSSFVKAVAAEPAAAGGLIPLEEAAAGREAAVTRKLPPRPPRQQ